MPAPAIFPLSPNWDSSYTVGYEFKTEILDSGNGKEQRRALRQMPRVSVDFGAIAMGDQRRALGRFMSKQNRPALLPALAGVHPDLTGKMSTKTQGSVLTNTITTVRVSFDADAGSVVVDPGVAGLTFNGREVFVWQPNWDQSVTATYDQPYEDVDYGFGRVDRFRDVAFSTETRQATFLSVTAAQAAAMVAFFVRMRGRRGEFYYSNRGDDLVPVIDLTAGTKTLTVDGTETATEFATDTVRRAIFLRLSDGTTIYQRVASIAAVGARTVVTLADAWVTTITRSKIVTVSWLTVCRFGSDQLQMEFLTNSVAQTQINLVTLEDLDPIAGPVLRIVPNGDIRNIPGGPDRSVWN